MTARHYVSGITGGAASLLTTLVSDIDPDEPKWWISWGLQRPGAVNPLA